MIIIFNNLLEICVIMKHLIINLMIYSIKKIQRYFGNLTLKLPVINHKPREYTGPSYENIVQERKDYMCQFYSHFYKQPLLITEGYYQYLYDHKANRYLDLVSGISTVCLGHSHPAITKVVQDQISKLTHTSPIYLSQYQARYSKMLCESLGNDFDSVYLCNSGGEANDFAVSLARLYSGEYKMVSLRNGYHGLVGNTANITNVNCYNSAMKGGFEFQKLAWPSAYRGNHKSNDSLISDTRQALNANTNGKVAGIILECIQGAGGIYPLPEGYGKRVTDVVRQYGGLVIVDEVQTGFGRMGKDFWGHKWQGIKPDIVTLAKGIGNGFPMGAVVTRKSISQKYKAVFFNTFGGGHLQSRVGIEVLNVIKQQKLAENAEIVGNYFQQELKKLALKHRWIGDVRGRGLMIGMQLVQDKETKQPAPKQTAEFMELTRERGLLTGKNGVYGNVIRIQPPLCITKEDVNYAIQAFDDALRHLK